MTDIQSLYFYLMAFTLSCSFASLAQRTVKNSQKLEMVRKTSDNRYYVFIVLSMLIPIIISGARYNVGIDYENYESGYYLLMNQDLKSYVLGGEVGHLLLIKLSKLVFSDPQGLFLFSSLITILFLYASLKEHKDNVSFFLVLFLYYTKIYAFSLNGMRQALAMSIILYSFKHLNQRNLKKYLFFVVLASLFHKTALIILPFYIIGENKKNKLFLRIMLSLFCVFVIFNINKILSFAGDISLLSSYSLYKNYAGAFNIDIFAYASDIIIVVLSVLFRHRLSKKNKSTTMYIWLYLYGVIFTLLGTVVPYADRLGMYFTITYILIVPYIIGTIKNVVLRKSLYLLTIIYGIVTFVVANYISNSHQIIPYNVFWNKF